MKEIKICEDNLDFCKVFMYYCTDDADGQLGRSD